MKLVLCIVAVIALAQPLAFASPSQNRPEFGPRVVRAVPGVPSELLLGSDDGLWLLTLSGSGDEVASAFTHLGPFDVPVLDIALDAASGTFMAATMCCGLLSGRVEAGELVSLKNIDTPGNSVFAVARGNDRWYFSTLESIYSLGQDGPTLLSEGLDLAAPSPKLLPLQSDQWELAALVGGELHVRERETGNWSKYEEVLGGMLFRSQSLPDKQIIESRIELDHPGAIHQVLTHLSLVTKHGFVQFPEGIVAPGKDRGLFRVLTDSPPNWPREDFAFTDKPVHAFAPIDINGESHAILVLDDGLYLGNGIADSWKKIGDLPSKPETPQPEGS